MSREVLPTPESKEGNVASDAEEIKDDPEDSASSRHECKRKEGNVDAGGAVWLNVLLSYYS